MRHFFKQSRQVNLSSNKNSAILQRTGARLSLKLFRYPSASIAFLLGALLLVLVNIAAVTSIWRAKEDATADWLKFMSSMGELAGQHADQTVAAAELLLQRVTDHVQLAGLINQDDLRRRFATLAEFRQLTMYKDDLPQVDVVTIVAVNGDVINFSRSFPAPSINLSDRDYFIAHSTDASLKLHISEPVRNRSTGKWTFYLSRKVVNSKGDFVAIILIGLESDYLGRFYKTIQLGHEEPFLTLTRSDGRVLARYPNDDAIMARTLQGAAFNMIANNAPNPALVVGPRATNPADSQSRLIWAKASKSFPISLTLIVTKRLYLERWVKSSKFVAYIAVVASLSIAGATVYLCRILVNREKAERTLQNTVTELADAKQAVQNINEELEGRVETRTNLLLQANFALDEELNERRRIEAELKILARFDLLTGLPNRTLFAHRLEQALAVSSKTGALVGLMFVDLDRFKAVNDAYGHEVGDSVLREAGARMQVLLQPSGVISRMGGDEFTVIVDAVDSIETFHSLAKKLVEGFAAPLIVNKKELFLTLSVGIAVSPTDSSASDALMSQANLAMHHAKAQGRNSFQFHSKRMDDDRRSRMAVEQALRPALERNEFELFYQIRISANTMQPVGMEALVRWNSPELGFISPACFIPVAEETGLIDELGSWVLRTACKQHASWQQEGLEPGVMGINVSAGQFRQRDFAVSTAKIASDLGVVASCLELEVTESLLMSDPENAKQQMENLRKLGFGIAIDDFGTGFSSLSHLKLFPATKLKIDRAFVMGIDVNSQDQAIASAIVAMAKTLSMTVTAEGVETPSQLSALEQIACDEYQGYLFSRPQPAEAVGQLLREARESRIKDNQRLTIISHEITVSPPLANNSA